MARFRYQAINANQQPVTGELDAGSVLEAVTQLQADGFEVQAIGFAGPDASPLEGFHAPDHPAAALDRADLSPSDLAAQRAALQLHLGRVLERGRAIVPALRAYAAEMKPGRDRRQLTSVIAIMERGDAAEGIAALETLPMYWIPLLSAALHSQDAGRILRDFLKESERASELRRQWWSTLAYPTIVACLAAAVVTLLSLLIIPIFRDIFLGFGLKLPRFTAMVLAISAWINDGRALLAAAVVAGLIALTPMLLRLLPPAARNWLSDRFGTPLGRPTALARFTQFAADLLEAGLEAPAALRIAGLAAGSPRLRRASWRLAGDIASGSGVDDRRYRRTLTASVANAVASDLPAASRVRLLREVSRCYEERARLHLSWAHGAVEPIALVTVGAIVGAIVIALFLPLFSLIQGLA